MNFNTAENGHFKATAVGHNARWGDYSVDRDLTWESGNRKFAATMTGNANFGAGALHASSPIITDIHFTSIWQPPISRVHSRRCSQERNTASHSREEASRCPPSRLEPNFTNIKIRKLDLFFIPYVNV